MKIIKILQNFPILILNWSILGKKYDSKKIFFIARHSTNNFRLELQQERETVARLRSQLEKSHARERQLRNQCEDLLSTLDRQKSAYRRHSNTKYDN